MAQYTLENNFFNLSIDTDQVSFSLEEKKGSGIKIQNSFLGAKYTHGIQTVRSIKSWTESFAGTVSETTTKQGTLRQITLSVPADNHGISYEINLGLLTNAPMMLWNMSVKNGGKNPIKIEKLDLFRVGYMIVSDSLRKARKQETGSISLHPQSGAPLFFSNGWQSWSHTRTYTMLDSYRSSRLGPIKANMCNFPGTPRPKGKGNFSSDMFALLGDKKNRCGVLLGFLSQKKHFGTIESVLSSVFTGLRMWANGDNARLDPGKSITTDWACLMPVDLDSPDPAAEYFEAVALENDSLAGSKKIPVGWCSWYEHFENITDEIIQKNIDTAVRSRQQLPLEWIQIDDGFQKSVGDWLQFNEKFPRGLNLLVDKIVEKGFSPGLWLAPFSLSRKSDVYKNHPDWVLKNKAGRPVNAGFLPQWGGFSTALDLTHPEALDYVKKVIRTAVEEWGFQYLKLDFLYAAALGARYHDPTKTRAQVMRLGLETVREAMGDATYFLGCGCPLGPAVGLVDSMRVSADVEANWYPKMFGTEFYFRQEPDFPAASLAILNSITRAALHNRWWTNDPDCLLLRPSAELTNAEMQTLTTIIALSGGSIFLSDDLPNLPDDRLKLAQTVLPPIGKTPHVVDWINDEYPARLRLNLQSPVGEWHLLTFLNWEDEVHYPKFVLRDYGLGPDQAYWVRDYWQGTISVVENGVYVPGRISPHGISLISVRPFDSGRPAYLGGDLHISQGLEVTSWQVEQGRVTATLSAPGEVSASIEVYVPGEPVSAELNGSALSVQESAKGIYRLEIDFSGSATVTLKY